MQPDSGGRWCCTGLQVAGASAMGLRMSTGGQGWGQRWGQGWGRGVH